MVYVFIQRHPIDIFLLENIAFVPDVYSYIVQGITNLKERWSYGMANTRDGNHYWLMRQISGLYVQMKSQWADFCGDHKEM